MRNVIYKHNFLTQLTQKQPFSNQLLHKATYHFIFVCKTYFIFTFILQARRVPWQETWLTVSCRPHLERAGLFLQA